MINMNVYIYGGKNRDEASISIIPNNQMPIQDEEYLIDATDGNGIMIVAFPKYDSQTEFAFTYWAEE